MIITLEQLEEEFQQAKKILIGVRVRWENETGIVQDAYIQPPIKKGERGCDHDIPPKVILVISFPGYNRAMEITECYPVNAGMSKEFFYWPNEAERIEP